MQRGSIRLAHISVLVLLVWLRVNAWRFRGTLGRNRWRAGKSRDVGPMKSAVSSPLELIERGQELYRHRDCVLLAQASDHRGGNQHSFSPKPSAQASRGSTGYTATQRATEQRPRQGATNRGKQTKPMRQSNFQPKPKPRAGESMLCDVGANALGYFFNMSGTTSDTASKAASPTPASFIECYLLHNARINGSEYGVGVPVDIPVVLGYFEGNELRPVDRLGGHADVEELLVHISSQLDLHDVGIYNTPVVMTLQGEDIGDDDDGDDDREGYVKTQQLMSGDAVRWGKGAPGKATCRESEEENEDLSVDEVVRLERIDESLDEPGSDEEEDEVDDDYDDDYEGGGIGQGDSDEEGSDLDTSDDDGTDEDEEEEDEELEQLERSSERPWSKAPAASHNLQEVHSHESTDDDHAEDAWVAQRVRAGDFENLEEESKVFGFMGSATASLRGAETPKKSYAVDEIRPGEAINYDDSDDEASFRRDHRRADRIVKFARDVSMIGSYRHRGRTYHLLKLRDPVYIVGKRNDEIGGAYHFTLMSEAETSKIATQIQRLLETRGSSAQRKRY